MRLSNIWWAVRRTQHERTQDLRNKSEAAAAGERLVLEGRPIVYDQPTTIKGPTGAYIEIIRTGALDGADLSDARLLYNHNLSKVPLARTPKTMQLVCDPAGLRNFLPRQRRKAYIRQYIAATCRHVVCVQSTEGR